MARSARMSLLGAFVVAVQLASCASEPPPAPPLVAPIPDAAVSADTAAETGHPDVTLDTQDAGGCDDAGSPEPVSTASLQELRDSVLSLRRDWLFRLDPNDEGEAEGWGDEAYDDSGWASIDAGAPWEDQGYPGYDGLAWYRKQILVPSSWQGSPVRVLANGIDDEYDLYVNGQWIRHHGEHPDRSVWGWQTVTRIDGFLRFGEQNLIAIRVNDWEVNGGIWRDIAVRRAVPLDPYKDYLPVPVIESQPDWVELYWEAWRMAWEKVSFGTPDNGLASAYMDEGFNEQIYQWDSSFICLFGRYGTRLFPVMATLDNFYDRQRPDGYIQRVYSETDGAEMGEPTVDEPMVNPPLFAWVEWEAYRTTGDEQRLADVFPTLERYFVWLKNNMRTPLGQGLYYQTDLGSGMDNTPRGDVYGAAWADMSMQQALAARTLALIADRLGLDGKKASWEAEHSELVTQINAVLWNDADGTYYDLLRSGAPARVKHIGAFWALLAGISDDQQTTRLVEHLRSSDEFYRSHLFPTLAASEPDYSSQGHYWRGGVWAPTNYMIVKGLAHRGHADFAREAAENHVRNMASVFTSPPTDEQRIAPEERDGDYATIWECYAPDGPSPATRWDDVYLSRQDFVGWSGLGPIAMLIENILGFEVVAPENKLIWNLTRSDRHGIENLLIGAEHVVSVVADARSSDSDPVRIAVAANRPFTLEVRRPGNPPWTRTVCAGSSHHTLP